MIVEKNFKWRLAQAAEIRWWRRYLGSRPVSVYLEQKKGYWRKVLDQANLRVLPGQRVLDAGCGPAGIFIALDHCRVTCVDPLLERYRQDLPHFDPAWYPWVNFYAVKVEDFTPETPFELIFCLNALNHFADLEKSLRQLRAALIPGGTMILTVDTHRSDWLKRIFQRLPGDILHPHQYALNDYQAMLNRADFSVVNTVMLKPGRIFDYWLIEAHAKK